MFMNMKSTLNDKSFEGEKFCSLLSSSGMWEKVLQFYPLPPSNIHSFQLCKTATHISTKVSCSSESRKLFVELSLAYSEMDESSLAIDWHLCVQISHFPGWPVTGGGEEQQTKQVKWVRIEVSLRWNRSKLAEETNKESASELPNLLVETLLCQCCGIFQKISLQHCSKLLRSKSFGRKTFAAY